MCRYGFLKDSLTQSHKNCAAEIWMRAAGDLPSVRELAFADAHARCAGGKKLALLCHVISASVELVVIYIRAYLLRSS